MTYVPAARCSTHRLTEEDELAVMGLAEPGAGRTPYWHRMDNLEDLGLVDARGSRYYLTDSGAAMASYLWGQRALAAFQEEEHA